MSNIPEPRTEPRPKQGRPGEALKQQTLNRPAPVLDFPKPDLSVEEAEERISPSETNVFDR